MCAPVRAMRVPSIQRQPCQAIPKSIAIPSRVTITVVPFFT